MTVGLFCDFQFFVIKYMSQLSEPVVRKTAKINMSKNGCKWIYWLKRKFIYNINHSNLILYFNCNFFFFLFYRIKSIWKFQWIIIFFMTWNNIWRGTQKNYCKIDWWKISVFKREFKIISGEKSSSFELLLFLFHEVKFDALYGKTLKNIFLWSVCLFFFNKVVLGKTILTLERNHIYRMQGSFTWTSTLG